MSTIACKNCQQVIASSTELCSSCGARNPTNYTSATIVIYRKSAYAGRLQRAGILVDGAKVANLGNDEAIAFDLPFGEHRIEVKFKGQFTNPRLGLNLASPKTQMFDLVMGFWGFRFLAR